MTIVDVVLALDEVLRLVREQHDLDAGGDRRLERLGRGDGIERQGEDRARLLGEDGLDVALLLGGVEAGVGLGDDRDAEALRTRPSRRRSPRSRSPTTCARAARRCSLPSLSLATSASLSFSSLDGVAFSPSGPTVSPAKAGAPIASSAAERRRSEASSSRHGAHSLRKAAGRPSRCQCVERPPSASAARNAAKATMPSKYSPKLDALLERVAVADVARRAIDRRDAERGDEERRLRPVGRAFDRAAVGTHAAHRLGEQPHERRRRRRLGRRAADRMVAAGGIGEGESRSPARAAPSARRPRAPAFASSRLWPGISLRIRLMRHSPGTAM